MRKYFLIFFFSFFVVYLFADEIILKGIFKQGGFFQWDLPEYITKCYFNDFDVPIYHNYIFVGLKKNQSFANDLIFVTAFGDTLSYYVEVKKTKYKTQKINKVPKKYVKKPKNKNLIKRIIARLDIKNDFLVKGVHLEGLRILGYPELLLKNILRKILMK